jgi:hypothetical protein
VPVKIRTGLSLVTGSQNPLSISPLFAMGQAALQTASSWLCIPKGESAALAASSVAKSMIGYSSRQ